MTRTVRRRLFKKSRKKAKFGQRTRRWTTTMRAWSPKNTTQKSRPKKSLTRNRKRSQRERTPRRNLALQDSLHQIIKQTIKSKIIKTKICNNSRQMVKTCRDLHNKHPHRCHHLNKIKNNDLNRLKINSEAIRRRMHRLMMAKRPIKKRKKRRRDKCNKIDTSFRNCKLISRVMQKRFRWIRPCTPWMPTIKSWWIILACQAQALLTCGLPNSPTDFLCSWRKIGPSANKVDGVTFSCKISK